MDRKLVIVNPEDRDWCSHRFILWVGQIGTTHLMIWAKSLDAASEHMCDWCVDNAPGYLSDESVTDEYNRLITEGKTEEEAQEEAEIDETMFGHDGIHYIPSYEWGITYEDPTRAQILELQGRPPEHRAKGRDPLANKRRRTVGKRRIA